MISAPADLFKLKNDFRRKELSRGRAEALQPGAVCFYTGLWLRRGMQPQPGTPTVIDTSVPAKPARNLPERGADPRFPPAATPRRLAAVVVTAIVQGAGFWLFPKAPLVPLLALVVVLPTVFYLTERTLPGRRVWLPPLTYFLLWLIWVGYNGYVAEFTALEKVTIINGILYFLFVFLSLPFVQAFAETGGLRLPAGVFSALMNRNVALLLLGGLALLPVGVVLSFGLANIRWDQALMSDPFQSWNPVSPFGFFCLFSPLTFAGAILWAQSSGGEGEGAALPFLRRTIGAVSGWVALLAALGMAGTMASGIIIGRNLFPDANAAKFPLLIAMAVFFWVSMSLAAREGTWAAKPRVFRVFLQAGVIVFPLFMVCLLGGYVKAWLLQEETPLLWSWQYIGFGVLLLAAFGHGIAVLARKWPGKASAVNVGVHVLMLGIILVSRVPLADPVRLEARHEAAKAVHRGVWSAWDEEKFLRQYGRYGLEGLDAALPGRELAAGDKNADLRARTQAAREKKQDDAKRETAAKLADIPVYPPGAAIPDEAFAFLVRHGRDSYLMRRILIAGAGERKIFLRDLNGDGLPEVVCINFSSHLGAVVGRNRDGVWELVGELTVPGGLERDGAVSLRPSPWGELVIDGTALPFKRVN